MAAKRERPKVEVNLLPDDVRKQRDQERVHGIPSTILRADEPIPEAAPTSLYTGIPVLSANESAAHQSPKQAVKPGQSSQHAIKATYYLDPEHLEFLERERSRRRRRGERIDLSSLVREAIKRCFGD